MSLCTVCLVKARYLYLSIADHCGARAMIRANQPSLSRQMHGTKHIGTIAMTILGRTHQRNMKKIRQQANRSTAQWIAPRTLYSPTSAHSFLCYSQRTPTLSSPVKMKQTRKRPE